MDSRKFVRDSAKTQWIVLLVCLLLGTQAYAQLDTGSITGTVKDESGAVIPKASVTLINQDTHATTRGETGTVGTYTFSPVRVGTYEIRVEAQGFERVSRTDVTVNVQQYVVVDFTLKPGSLLQTVTVSAAAPALQTQDASMGSVVGSSSINDLPLNGRNYVFLAQLGAGVNVAQMDGRGLASNGSFVANGTQPDQDNYLLDGVDNNSDESDFLAGTNYQYKPAVDAIQEFKIQTSNYSAEFGRSAGAVLNATIKSGTNQVHGDAWEFVRNDKLDAANFFENSTGELKGEFRQNQFGATLGGPIVIPHVYNGRDKSFFFVDYEGTRIRQAAPQLATVPTADEVGSGFTDLSDLIKYQSGTRTDLLGRTFPLGQVFDPATTRAVTAGQVDPITGIAAAGTGYVRDPFPGNILPQGRLDLNAVKILGIYPTANEPGLFNNYASDPINHDDIDQGDVRIDHNFSDKDQIFGRVSLSQEVQNFPGPMGGIADGGSFTQAVTINNVTNDALSWTHTLSPTLVNELRLGVVRMSTSRVPFNGDNLTNIPAQYGIQGVPQLLHNGGLPEIAPTGLTRLGPAAWLPSWEVNQISQLQENVTKIVGKHTFKGGFQFQHIKFQFFQPPWSRGEFDFYGTYTEVPNTGGGNTGLAQMLLTPGPSSVGAYNNVGGASGTYASNYSTPAMTRNAAGAYIQDNWKVTPKLTVDLGVRWEYQGHGVGDFNNQADWTPAALGQPSTFTMTQEHCKKGISPSFIALTAKDGINIECTTNDMFVNADKKDFGPRLGLAYHVMPKLVVRAGWGMFFGTSINGDTLLYTVYPYYFSVNFPAPDTAHPITYANGTLGTLENGLTWFTGDPSTVNALGLGLGGAEKHFHNPYTMSFNFTTEYQLTPNQTFSLAYVGTQARHLTEAYGDNIPNELLPPSATEVDYVPYPDFEIGSGIRKTGADSEYNGLQVNFERRLSQGMNLLANYTYSKCRADDRQILNNNVGGYRAPLLPGFGIQGDYALCDFDIPQVVHFSGTYALPLGKGRKYLANSGPAARELLGGWKVNAILTLQDGQPFGIPCVITTASGSGCFALLVPGQSIYGSTHNVNQWMNPAAFMSPPVVTSVGQTNYAPLGGNPTELLGPGFHRFDLSLFKEFPVTESKRFEFRAEFFNLTNTPQFSNPGFSGQQAAAAPGALDYTDVNTFGKITSTRDAGFDQREIQFALKFYW